MKPSILVLGAGMIGTCTALHLQQCGFDVTLIDRRGPGEETSSGNAGLIQREAVEPYAFVRDPLYLLRAALGLGAEINWQLPGLIRMAGPLWTYFRHSSAKRHAQATAAFAALIAHALSEHQHLLNETQAYDLVRSQGFRFVYRSPSVWKEGLARAQRLHAQFGIEFNEEDGVTLAQAEPVLGPRLVGAVHWIQPWSIIDPSELVKRYAMLFQQRGGHWVQADAQSLGPIGHGWRVGLGSNRVEASQAVIALGPWSDILLRRLGYRFPLFVKRGYHQHYRPPNNLRHPILDVERGYVLAPMRQGLRLTTGAEFAALDAAPTPIQVDKAASYARELLDLGTPHNTPPWLGARPCVADMLPLIGPAPRHKGLWLHLGHAHQGFTLGPASARLLAQQIAGESPYIDPRPYLPSRFDA